MSLILDITYAKLAGMYLEGFVQTKPTLFNARCPFCGDSKKDKLKKRFYIFEDRETHNNLVTMCHNCGYSGSMFSFLETFNIPLWKEYKMEWFKENGNKTQARKVNKNTTQKAIFKTSIRKSIKPKEVKESKEFPKPSIKSIESLDDNHVAKRYLIERSITYELWENFLYTNNFKNLAYYINNDTDMARRLRKEPRIVMPFYENGLIVAVQGRAIGKSDLKYITIKVNENIEKIYGLWKINYDKPIRVVEGPIDSLFIYNCVATCDSSLYRFENGDVYIFDNQPRNKEIVKKIERTIDMGKKVVIWDSTARGKDINDMIVNGLSVDDIDKMITKRTFSGIKAKMEFAKWNKIT